MSQPLGVASLPQLWKAILVSLIAEHSWKWGAPALPRTGTGAQDSSVSVVKGQLGGTLGMFCHPENCTKHVVT